MGCHDGRVVILDFSHLVDSGQSDQPHQIGYPTVSNTSPQATIQPDPHPNQDEVVALLDSKPTTEERSNSDLFFHKLKCAGKEIIDPSEATNFLLLSDLPDNDLGLIMALAQEREREIRGEGFSFVMHWVNGVREQKINLKALHHVLMHKSGLSAK